MVREVHTSLCVCVHSTLVRQQRYTHFTYLNSVRGGDPVSFFSEVSRMQSPFSKNPGILSMDWMHRGGCNFLPLISTTKFKLETRGEESREKEYLTSIQVISIQVQDCLLGSFPILVLFSRLVRHLLAVYSLCLPLQ